MFPMQPTNDLGSQIQTTTQENQFQDDLISNYDFFENNLLNFSIGSSDKQPRKRADPGLPRPQKQKQKQKQKQREHESSSKKAMHREVEKKRRQEMSNLHAALNSLLPHDHLEGKRSVCDQIEEAANHIKRMEGKIEELKGRRDRLKSLFDNKSDYVTIINMGSNGLEILISQSHGINANNLGLSRVLAELQRNELDVVSCVSSRINETFLHKIYVEARNMINHDLFLLQDRLSKAMK